MVNRIFARSAIRPRGGSRPIVALQIREDPLGVRQRRLPHNLCIHAAMRATSHRPAVRPGSGWSGAIAADDVDAPRSRLGLHLRAGQCWQAPELESRR